MKIEDDFNLVSDLVILALMISASGILKAATSALLATSPGKARMQSEGGNAQSTRLKEVLDNLNRYISAVQLCNSLLTLFTGAFAALNIGDDITAILVAANIISAGSVTARLVVTLVILIVVSCLLLVFGEMIPKRLGTKKSEKVSRSLLGLVRLLNKLLSPLLSVLGWLANRILKLFRINPEDSIGDVTEEAIRVLVDDAGDRGGIDMTEREMINNVFEFDNTTVEDIAIHRKDVVALDINANREEIINTITDEGYSRIPIYDENIDNIVGILHVKDFMSFMFRDPDADLDKHKLMREPYFVPLSKKTDQLFDEMKKNKVHLAIVVDEYGGTEGIVTMEDLIEEIMGNIYDEYDDVENPLINKLNDTSYLVEGTADLELIADFFGKNMPVDEYDTVSGFVIGQLGRIPDEHERLEITYDGLTFKIYKVDEKRIATVVVETEEPL